MSHSRSVSPGPHDNTKSYIWGNPHSSSTKIVVIFLHGKGGDPVDDLPVFIPVFEQVGAVAAIGLRARDEAWYTSDWHSPLPTLEPFLTSSLTLLDRTIHSLPSTLPILLLGFSQGASIILSYLLSHPLEPTNLRTIVALSGCLIGPDPAVDWPAPEGRMMKKGEKKVYLGWGDGDRYYRKERTERDRKVLEERGAEVEVDVFPGMGHYITQAELDKIKTLLEELV